jgi:hypothetical protein
MNFKSAVLLETERAKDPESTLIKLTNPYRYEKKSEQSQESRIEQSQRMKRLAACMRQKWEAYHAQNDTWWDYSDDGSWYSDSDDEDDWQESDDLRDVRDE